MPRARRARHAASRRDGAARRRPVRPLDDGITESVRVIEFIWSFGGAVQPVLMLERELLD
jgi:hypothetical protein